MRHPVNALGSDTSATECSLTYKVSVITPRKTSKSSAEHCAPPFRYCGGDRGGHRLPYFRCCVLSHGAVDQGRLRLLALMSSRIFRRTALLQFAY